MQNNKYLSQIASKNGSSDGLIRASDSDVYKVGNQCIKHYFGLTKQTIQQYHVLQNWLSKNQLHMDLGISNNLESINTSKILKNKSHTEIITQINFHPLELGNNIYEASEIETKKDLIITEVNYIQGDTLFDICMNNQDDYNFQKNIYNILALLNKQYQTNIKNINLHADNPMDKFQIHGINCKITGYKNGILYITITDTARNINEIVRKNQNLISSIIKKT